MKPLHIPGNNPSIPNISKAQETMLRHLVSMPKNAGVNWNKIGDDNRNVLLELVRLGLVYCQMGNYFMILPKVKQTVLKALVD